MDLMHSKKHLLPILIIVGLNTPSPGTSQSERGANNTETGRNPTSAGGNQDRIVGGQTADPGEFPFVVSLKHSSPRRHFCGGSLLTLQHVLTACHCLTKPTSQGGELALKPPRSTVVYAGSLKLYGRDAYKQPGRKVVIHPSCERTSRGWHYDVGIVITRPFRLEYSVIEPSPLTALPNRTALQDLMRTGMGIHCYAIGWGSTREKGPFSNNLMKVHLTLIAQELCQLKIDSYSSTHGYSLAFHDGSQICAYGGHGMDACQGDSGGPLSCNIGGESVILGVVSWGFGCAREVPAVYGRIDGMRPWLEEVLQENTAPLRTRGISDTASLALLTCLVNQLS